MRYIESWLTGLGLQDIIPKLEKHGITTPKKLAALTLKEMYEVVGVEDAEDRKKLYFLIQRLQTILSNKAAAKGGDEAAVEAALPAAPAPTQPKATTSSTTSSSSSTVTSSPPSSTTAVVKPAQSKAVDPLALSGSASEEDLRALRRKRRASVEPLPPPPPPAAPSNSAVGNSAPALPPQAPMRARPGTSATTGTEHQIQLPKATPSAEPTLPARRESTGGAVVNHSGSTPLERYGAARSSRASTGGAASVASSVNSLHSLSSTGALSVASSLSVSTSLTSSVENLIRGRKLASNEAPASAYIRSSSPIAKSEGHPPSSSSASASASSSVAVAGRKKDSPPRQKSVHAPSSSSASSSSGAAGKAASQQAGKASSSATASSAASKAAASAKSLPKPSSSPVSSPTRVSPPGRNRSETGNSTSSINSIPPPPPPPVPETDAAPAPFSSNNASPPQAAAAPVYVEDMAIRVVVRKRPLSSSEVSRGDRDVMEIRVGGEVHVHEPKTRVDLTKVIETTSFAFDDSFDDCDSNETIYSRTVRPLVEFAFEGGKSSCFAYGQTGSGKTFSLMGSNPHDPASCAVNAGLYVLAARDIFALRKTPAFADKTTGQSLSVVVSCFEIYGGKLFDLLNERNQVKCLEDARGQVQVLGLTDHTVESVGDLLDLMSIAHEFRSVGSTGANAESSRSHLIMQLTLKAATQDRPGSAPGRRAQGSSSHAGKLSFIDLAGSERGADTTHNNKQTRMEGAEINTSLLALKEVIRSLERKHGHTPFRGSKLTQVLKDSFVGDKTRTCMIACVSPANTNCEHSLNTLRYADRVKEHQAGGGGAGGSEEGGAGGNNGSSPYSAPQQPREREEVARPATASSAPSSRENRRNSLGSDGPAAGSKAPKAPASRYSSAGGVAPVGHVGHSPVRAGGGNTAAPKRPSTAGSAAPALAAGSAASKRPATGAPPHVPAPFPLPADKEKEKDKASPSPVLMHHPALSSSPARSAAVSAAAAASAVPAPASVPAPAPAPKSGLQALAAAGTRLLQGKLGIGSSSSSSSSSSTAAPTPVPTPGTAAAAAATTAAAVPVKKHSINIDLEERDEDLSAAMSKVTIHTEGNKNVALVSSLEAEGIKKTLSLLSAHKRTIAETVEAMKEEMELVQGMESAEERDAEKYVEALESVLRVKAQAVAALRIEVDSFRAHRKETATQREGR